MASGVSRYVALFSALHGLAAGLARGGAGALLCLVLFAAAAPAQAQFRSDELVPFAVHIERTPKQSWPGYGVYLGNGYVLTAAHVVGQAAETLPRVVVEGKRLPTEVVKEGTFETNDLTLLRVDRTVLPGRLLLRRLPLCAAAPVPEQQVTVATPEGAATSHVLSPRALPPNLRAQFPTAIADVETTGNSGSGVFDSLKGCLLGIISRKMERIYRPRGGGKEIHKDLAKYFVPPAVIAAFLPPAIEF